ncbi:hypothetical protein chiPu_0021916 [Chiloscyllium punctatum]|uniref:Phorbol-ester/DAG-type domain-containing protein n=1 Tax=Chiloscyllium punctatum TaxID=137246 RepID=A0A401RF28_CHIPU|nr:hypothetical protein [Chiloscyllium punctatum]
MPETCVPCGKRIRFGRVALKCRSCSIVAHSSCKERCPAICSPNFTTISVKNGEGAVGDFAPQTVPMIPSLVVHCVNEIEQRGLQEVVEQLLSLPSDYWSRIVPVAPSNSEPAPTLTGHLFKPLTSPEAAELMNRSPGCWMAPGILAM